MGPRAIVTHVRTRTRMQGGTVFENQYKYFVYQVAARQDVTVSLQSISGDVRARVRRRGARFRSCACCCDAVVSLAGRRVHRLPVAADVEQLHVGEQHDV